MAHHGHGRHAAGDVGEHVGGVDVHTALGGKRGQEVGECGVGVQVPGYTTVGQVPASLLPLILLGGDD